MLYTFLLQKLYGWQVDTWTAGTLNLDTRILEVSTSHELPTLNHHQLQDVVARATHSTTCATVSPCRYSSSKALPACSHTYNNIRHVQQRGLFNPDSQIILLYF